MDTITWNDFEKIMIMGNQGLTKLLLIYLFNKDLLTTSEFKNLKIKYAAAINFKGENLDDVLKEI